MIGAGAVDAQVRGLPQLAAGTRTLADRIDRGAQAEFLRVADQTATMVRGRVPHRTGRLASTVQARRIDRGAELGMGEGIEYGGWIEYGGSRGRPLVSEGRYFGPAAREAGEMLPAAGDRVAREQIGGMAWPTVI